MPMFLSLVFASCSKEPQPLTRQEISRKIDSLTKVRIDESNEQAKRDLDHRIKIEVKVKVDSILNAQLRQQKKDTTQKKSPIQKKALVQQKKPLLK
jgi:two-component sensor histidine kinase